MEALTLGWNGETLSDSKFSFFDDKLETPG